MFLTSETLGLRKMIHLATERAHRKGRSAACDQAPSDRPEFRRFLDDAGGDSTSNAVARVLKAFESNGRGANAADARLTRGAR
jgi:hypothetical protein